MLNQHLNCRRRDLDGIAALCLLNRSAWMAPLALIICLGLAACGKKAPVPLSMDAATNKVEGLFDHAAPEIKTLADNAVQAMSNGDLPHAYMLLQTLVGQKDLSPEQREVATGAFLGVGEKIRESAASGDEKSQEFQRMHRSSK